MESEKSNENLSEHEKKLYNCLEAWISYTIYRLRNDPKEVLSKTITDYVWGIIQGYRKILKNKKNEHPRT